MSAPSGPRPLSRGEGRGRARDAPQARAGSEDESQNRNGLRPTRGGSMNNTQDRYAQRGRLTRGNWTTARNGRSPRNPRTTMNANPEHNIPQQYDPRTAAGRQGAGAVRRAVPSPSTNTPANANTPPKPRWRDPTKVPYAEYKDRMYELWTTLKKNREKERKDAIRDGFLADPDKPTKLADAITIVGTCKDMCPEFERVERIVQQMVDGAEKTAAPPPLLKVPNENMMVKRFRRSAAGYDEQLPSDLRPPAVLKKTLDYLFRDVLAKNPLAKVHKFVWDRTRGIRNDFSIQQVTKIEDVKIAIQCFERIARFHILSLHLLSHPHQDNGEFDPQQEHEQLTKTLQSLMYYYEDNKERVQSHYEAEFRAYCVNFAFRVQRPDGEQRMSDWRGRLLQDERLQKALDLQYAASNISGTQGPLRPNSPFAVAQENYSRFWSLLKGDEVPYLLACKAETQFNHVRTMALEGLWRAYKRGAVVKLDDWILADLMPVFGFDTEDQVAAFCEEHGFTIGEREDGSPYLDITSVAGAELTDMNPRRKQLWSWELVESKRRSRTISGVIDGLSVSACKRVGATEKENESPTAAKDDVVEELFFSDYDDENSNKPKGLKQLYEPDPVKPASTTPASNPFQSTKPASNPFQSTAPVPNPFQGVAQTGSTAQKGAPHNPFAALQKPGAASPTLASNPFQTSAISSVLTPGTSNPFQITTTKSDPSQTTTTVSNSFNALASASDTSQTAAAEMGRVTKWNSKVSPFVSSTPVTSSVVGSFAANSTPSVFGQPSGTPATNPAPSVFGQPSTTNPVPSVFSQPSISSANNPVPSVFGQPSAVFGQQNAPTNHFAPPSVSSSSTPPSSTLVNSFAPRPLSSSMSLPSISSESNAPLFNFGAQKFDFTQPSTSTPELGKSIFSSLKNTGQQKATFGNSSAESPPVVSTALDASKGQLNTSSQMSDSNTPSAPTSEQGESVFSDLQNSTKKIFTFDTSGSGPSPEAVAQYEAYKNWQPASPPTFSFTTPPVPNTEQGTSGVAASEAPKNDLFSRITKPDISDAASGTGEAPKSDLFSRITKPETSNLGSRIMQPEDSDLGSRITQPPSSGLGSGSGNEPHEASKVDSSSAQALPATIASDTAQTSSTSSGISTEHTTVPIESSDTPARPRKSALKYPSPVLGTNSATPITTSKPTNSTPAPNPTPSTLNSNVSGPRLTPRAQQPDGVRKGGVPYVTVQQARINAAKSGLRERVLDTLAHELVCENDGILNQYLQHSIDPIIIKAMDKVTRQEERQTVMIAREFLLSKKYVRKWRENSYKRVLRRKGREKRKAFAQNMEELARNAKRASSENVDFESPPEKRARGMPPPPKPADSIFKSKSLPNQLGTKRSAEEAEDPRQSKRINRSLPPPRKGILKPHHKRSQTLGNLSDASGLAKSQRLFFSPKSAKYVDAEHSIDAMREKARRMRIPLGPQDSTRTDYFLLKSYGLDPDMPLNPALRKRPAPGEDDLLAPCPKRVSPPRSYGLSTQSALDGGSRKRRASDQGDISPRSSKRASPPHSYQLESQPATNDEATTTNAQPSTVASTPEDDDDEALIAQVRQVREAMSESVDWYREVLRHSSSETEKERIFREFKYTPSRTEMRLKATGARGLLPKNWEPGSSVGTGSSIGRRRESDASFGEQLSNQDDFHIQKQIYDGDMANKHTPTPAPRAMGFAAVNNGTGSGTSGFASPSQSYRNGMGMGSGSGASADDAIEL